MSVVTDLVERIRALLFWRRLDRELDEEMRFHLERETDERRRHGDSPEAARRGALRAFGGVDRFTEEARDARGVSLVRDLGADIRYAARGLIRNPGFTVAAVLVLGIGIGAATATFAVVDAVLISELPYPHARRLVRIYPTATREMTQLSTVDYQAIREQARSFDAVGALALRVMALSGSGDPQRVLAGRVTAGFFDALSVWPAEGRLVEERDETTGAPPVVVLSHGMAEQLFGSARAAPGRAIMLDGASHEVIGVLPGDPADRVGLAGLRAGVWPALQLQTPTRRGPFWIRPIARLREGVTLDDATRDLAHISRRLFPIWASSFQDREARFTPVPLREAIVGTADRRISLFAAAVVLVLLVAVGNVATLVLVRAAARAPDLSVRAALGAPRVRLARLLLVEGVTLTTAAALVGIALAAVAVTLVGRLAPALPRLAEVSLDGEAVAFAAAVTLVAGLLISLSPVLTALSRRTSTSLRTDARRTGASPRTNLVRGTLVVGEFALAVPLLLGAGLLLNTLLRLQRVDPGFDPGGVVSASLTLPPARYGDSAAGAFWRRLEARATESPAIAAVGLSTELPPDEPGNENNFDLVDQPVPVGTAQPTSPWVYVTNGYFAALDVPLLDGRLFMAGDSGPAPPVVVVSRAWAERFFPQGGVVGRQLIEGGCLECPRTTIVGVVGDVKYLGLRQAGEAVYGPLEQSGARSGHVVARSRAAAADGLRALRDAVRSLDPQLPLAETTLESRLDAELADPRRWTAVVGGFGASAALLAALGIFGLMSFVVRQRRREIGVRIALGADPASVTWMVVWRGMRLAGLGAMCGLLLAALEARWLRALLFDVGAADPLTLGAVAAVLLGAALLACWIPGRGAARISPVEAIAAE
jgi:predicted permease